MLGGGILTSCQKEKTFEPAKPQQINHEKLANNIISFRKEVLNPDKRKVGELITLDSAINIMEASFNFHHGVYNKNYAAVMYDSVIIETTYHNDSEISMAFVQNLYASINDSIYSIFDTCSYLNKTIKFVDIYFETMADVNYIKTLIAIGNENLQKAGSTPVTPLTSTEDLWAGATPFNDRQNESWDIAGNYNFINIALSGHSGMFLPPNDFSNAINDEIILPYSNSNDYIYFLSNTNYSEFHYYYSEIYQFNTHITTPDEEDELFYFWTAVWNNVYLKWEYRYMDENNELVIMEEPPLANYRQMNKYYNVCLAHIDYYKPSYKEPIDCNFAVGISDFKDSPTWYYRWLMGKVKVTYASNSPYPRNRLTAMEFIGDR